MKKLKSDLRDIHEGLSKFRYTNLIFLIIVFLTGFLLSAGLNQSRENAIYTRIIAQGFSGKTLPGGRELGPFPACCGPGGSITGNNSTGSQPVTDTQNQQTPSNNIRW